MNTLEFLRRVLPTQGKYAVAYNSNGGKDTFRHKFVDSIEALAYQIRTLNGEGWNVYYAAHTFDDASRRKQDNALWCKTLYMDLDCGPGKPFAKQREAIKWLSDFIAERNIPMPMLVSSGNGVHVYWVFKSDVSEANWQPLADALKDAVPLLAANNKIQKPHSPIDTAVTADAARVLRPVGCVNRGLHGDEALVSRLILDPKQDVTLDDMQELINSFTPVSTGIKKVNGKRKSRLASLSTYDSLPPADADMVYDKCKQVRWAVDNQSKIAEVVWHALMGVAAYCGDSEEVGKRWSEQDTTRYDVTNSEVITRIGRWQNDLSGPATCNKFDSENPGGCDKCPFAGKITTPVQLGVRRQEKEADDTAPTEGNTEIPLPEYFRRTDQGIAQDNDGVEIVISPYDIYPHSEGYDVDSNSHVYRFVWKHPRLGWKYLVLPTDAFTSGLSSSAQKFIAECNKQGMAIAFKGMGERLQMFLRGYIEELKKMNPPIDSTSAMGWQKGKNKFVLGDTLFVREDDGSVSEHKAPLASGVSRSLAEAYCSEGTREDWVNGTADFAKDDLKLIQLSILMSLAAPIIGVTGLPGATINYYGETGAGKTLAQHVAQSIYGAPEELYTPSSGTVNSLYAALATRGSLPMLLDEATTMPSAEIGRLLMGISQGREKPRLNQDSSMKEPRRFSTIVQTSSNKPMGGLIASAGYEVAAQQYRVIDLLVDKNPIFSDGTTKGAAIWDKYARNYGIVGREWIKHIVSIDARDRKIMYDRHKADFKNKYGGFEFQGEERYWEAMSVVGDMVGSMAKDLGLIKFDERDSIQMIIDQTPAARKAVVETIDMTTPLSVVSQYMNDLADCTATVVHTDGRSPMAQVPPRGLKKLLARIDLHRDKPSDQPHSGTVTFDKRAFRDWLIDHGSDIRSIEKYLGLHKLDRTPASGRVTLDKDIPDINVGQVRVLCVDLDCAELEGIMDNTKGVMLAPPTKFNVVQGGQT